MRKCGAGVVLAIAASVAGCGSTVGCNDTAITDLVIQSIHQRHNFIYRNDFRGDASLARAKELADETLAVVTTLTRRAATAENPQALCEAKIHFSSYDINWNHRALEEEKAPTSTLPPSPRERARTTDLRSGTDEERQDYEAQRLQANQDYAQAQAEAREASSAVRQRNQQRREEFFADPANIVRQGPRKEGEIDVTYTAAVTDDGRAVVRIED